MRRTKEDAEQTRKAILASAMDIFYEKGYSKTTFDEIAKRINLTKGAVYWYFRNKPDIVAALINEYSSEQMQFLQKFKPSEDVDFSNITNMILYYNKRIKEDPQMHKYLFFILCQMEWSEAILNKIQPAIEETKKMTLNLFLEILQALQAKKKIKEDVNVDLIGDILLCSYMGIMNSYFAKRLACDFDEVTKMNLDLIFKSIKTKGEDDEN